MARKILDKSSPGTSTTWAADDWDYINKYLGGGTPATDVDQSATDPVSIKTNTRYWDNRLRVWNPAKTFSYNIRSLALTANRDVTLPLLTSNDEFVMLLASQTMQNKIQNLTNNTLTDTAATTGGIPKHNGTKYVNIARGSAGQVPTVNAGGTDWTWADPTALNVADNAVSTAKIANGAVTNAKLASATITGDKIVNDGITESKISQITDKAKLNSQIVYYDDEAARPTFVKSQKNEKWAEYSITTPTGADGLFNGFLGSTGTHARVISTTSGIRAEWTTGAVTGNQAGIRTTGAITRANNNPRLSFKINYSTTNVTAFVGFTSSTSGFDNSTNPLQDKHGIGFRMSSAETNIRFMSNDGTGPSTHSDLSPNTAVAAGGTHTFELYTNDAGVTWHLELDGTDNTRSTELPGTGTDLAAAAWVETREAAAKNMDIRAFGFRGFA